MHTPASLSTFTRILAGAFVLFLLSACRPAQAEDHTPTPTFPTPTLNPLFFAAPSGTPPAPEGFTASGAPLAGGEITATANAPAEPTATQELPTPTPQPTEPPTVTPTFAPSPTPTIAATRSPVYDDRMDSNWAIKYSTDMRYNERDADAQHEGKYSISFAPLADFASLLLSVRQTSTQTFPHSEVLGVRFWLYSGDHEVEPSDLTVSIIGSNRFPFWIEGDSSVESASDPVFPETPLSEFGITETIPPETWTEIIVWLEDIADEPEYENVSAITIKNAAGFRYKVYIDEVDLLLALANP
jgi:hypothetical protein